MTSKQHAVLEEKLWRAQKALWSARTWADVCGSEGFSEDLAQISDALHVLICDSGKNRQPRLRAAPRGRESA